MTAPHDAVAAYPGAPVTPADPRGPAGPPRDRGRLRRRLLLVGLVPLLVVLLVGVKVVLMLGHDRDGRAAFDDDPAGAATSFADNSTLNVVETWIAPFGEGTALLADGEYDAALDRLGAALDHVPDEERCTVLVNTALAHEGLGDAASEDEDLATATEQWEAGRDALASADCPTDAGRGEEQTATALRVDERLADKLDVDEETEPEPPKEQEEQKPPPPSKEQEEKEKKLERRNQRGQDDRRDQQEYDEYDGGGSDGPSW